jgi:uncharacterized protein (UPF0332 family)
LIASQDARQIGDYGLEKEVSEAEAQQVISWAEEFFDAAKAYISKD